MRRRFRPSLSRPLSTIPTSPRRPTFRPGVESLEEMILPSGVTFVPSHLLAGHPLASHQATAGPAGLNPTQVRHAYGFDQITFQNGTVTGNGAGETIAIVDAYDDPSIANDLAVFDQQFGLAAPPSFVKVGINSAGAASTTQFPTADAGWAGEIELDVEWAHAMAPGAKILLVEANSASDTDLMAAVNYARQQPGVVTVSMSWGAGEFSGEQNYDSYFTTPSGHGGVTFFGSSGDSGSPAIWPALSTHVVGVGGTSLSVNSAGTYLGESGWSGSGGGLSTVLSQPSYQQGLVIHSGSTVISSGGHRAGPDVAFDADPNTGVAVYGSYGWGGWAQVGGTSAAAPQWAALVAIADQGRALAGLGSLDGFTQTLPDLYQLPAGDFHDITSGSNGGYQAGPGYDLVTGRGSPVANLVVRDLVGGSTSQPPTGGSGTSHGPTVATAAHVVSQTPTTAALSVLGADRAGESSLTYTWRLTSAPASVTVTASGTNAAKNVTVTFSTLGTYNFQVTITDPSGLSATSQVSVTVSPVLTSVVVTPGTATVAPNGTQQFSASARDQFGNALATQPSFHWSATGSGTVGGSGLFTAAGASGGATVQATAGAVTGTASVSVAASSVLFRDNFSNGASNWTVTSGYGDYYLDNSTGNNRLMVYNDGTTVSRVVAGQSSWTNYSYQATLNIDSLSSGSASLLARVQDNTHLYFFGYNVALGEWMIAVRNGWNVTILATSAPFALQYNQDYTVRADLSGNSLKLYVGGVLEVSTTDSTYASGRIGFSGTNALAYLGDVVVTSLPAPAEVATPHATAQTPAWSQYDALFATLFNSAWQRHGSGEWWSQG
jgi:subtilase family serine protease